MDRAERHFDLCDAGRSLSPRAWGVTTLRNDTVFVHVLNWRDRQISLPAIPLRIGSARLLSSSETVRFIQTEAGVVLTLPPGNVEQPDRIVVLAGARPR